MLLSMVGAIVALNIGSIKVDVILSISNVYKWCYVGVSYVRNYSINIWFVVSWEKRQILDIAVLKNGVKSTQRMWTWHNIPLNPLVLTFRLIKGKKLIHPYSILLGVKSTIRLNWHFVGNKFSNL